MPGFEIERQAVEFFLARLLAHIDELKLSKYPGDLPGPGKWLDLCAALADTAFEYLEKSKASSTMPADERRLLRDTQELANNIYSLLVEMDGATLEDLPYSVVTPMQRWLQDLQLKNTSFFRAIPKAIYEVRRFPLLDFSGIREPSVSLKAAISKPDEWPILRITVPAKALSLLPHFAIVAHEVGHIVFDNLSPKIPADHADSLAYVRQVQTTSGATTISPEGAVIIQNAYARWVMELFADAVGLCLLGPAFFFALCAFLESLGPDYALSKTHPPTVLRRKIAYAKLNRGTDFDFLPVFKKHTGRDLTETFNSGLLESPPAPTDIVAQLQSRGMKSEHAAIFAYLPSFIEKLANKIYAEVESHIRKINPQLLYSSARFDEDLAFHLDALTNAIPPIETGVTLDQRKPTDFPTILNVGWVALLTKLDKLAVKEDHPKLAQAEKAEKLHALLIKAVELSEARRLWSSL